MSVLRNVNYMKRFIKFPCATPNPIILIETAFEAALPVLIELFSLQLVQLAMPVSKLIAAAKAGKLLDGIGVKKDRKGKSGGHGVRIGSRDAAGRVSNGERLGPNTWLFNLADREQQFMYWWMIADLATQFQARWTSLIYAKQNCKFAGQCYRQGGFVTNYGPNDIVGAILPNMSAGEVFSGGTLIQVKENRTTGKQRADVSIAFTGTINCAEGPQQSPVGARLALFEAQTGKEVASALVNTHETSPGRVKSGGFVTIPRGSAARSYAIGIVNPSHQNVGCSDGVLRLSGGFCVSSAPLMPFDPSHLAGRVSPRPRPIP